MAVSKKIDDRLHRREKRYETKQLMKTKRSEDYDVFEEVFDRSTLMIIYSLLNNGVIDHIHGVVGAGKESRIYLGVDSKGENLAIKIYLWIRARILKNHQPIH